MSYQDTGNLLANYDADYFDPAGADLAEWEEEMHSLRAEVDQCPRCHGTGFYPDTEEWQGSVIEVETECEVCEEARAKLKEIA